MPKNVATPKQEGGGGYTFEDKVAATYLLRMLNGMCPLNVEAGQIESVRFQKRVDGWFLDDLVLFLRGIDGCRNVLAISLKSNEQITKNGFPADFTKTIWEQSLHIETQEFNIDRDYLALATSPLDTAVKKGWDGLLTKAIDSDAMAFANRISTTKYSNDIERAIFCSLHCPDSVDSSKTPTDTANLLKRLRHLQFDFSSEPSTDESYCISRCVELLRDGGPAEASSLWEHLKQIARRFDTSGGDLTRSQLADLLRKIFSLNEFSNYVSDWRKLANDFTNQTELVRDKLAGKLQLSRSDLETQMCEHRATALVGASGSGKTVIAKQIACNVATNGHAVWLTPSELNTNKLSVQFADLGLLHSFSELIAQPITHNGVIVIDGCERLNQTGLTNLAVLLRRAKIESESTPWSFVFTCGVDFWGDTFRALQREYGAGIRINVKTIEFQFDNHRSVVAEAFPNLSRMLQRSHLAPVFSNLKILDLVLSNIRDDTDTAAWIGETNILDWCWSHIVDVGPVGSARSRFIQKLACVEADQFLPAVPIGEFDSDECRLSVDLMTEQVIWNRDEKFGFEHDLWGDWARTRFLLSHQHKVATLAQQKVLNPRWHRAIRLYGLRLLENRSHDIGLWRQLLSSLSMNEKHTVESDLILESVVFAANAEVQLQSAWSTLCESEGKLLNRLLTRFLHVATLPDPVYSSMSDNAATAALHRYPFWPLWLPVLRVLFLNRADVIRLSTDQATQIADLWLKNSGENWPLRDEAGQILLDATTHIINEIKEKAWRAEHELSRKVFSRLLTAASVHPEKVANLALLLVERREDSLFPVDAVEEAGETREEEEMAAFLNPWRGPLADPWPDGPLRRVNREVHEGFLDSSDPLQYLFAVNPNAAKEVLLALLIREPLPTMSHRDFLGMGLDKFLHVETEPDWQPAMFFHGPFLSFLRTDQEKAIDTIITLTNFVTQRLVDNRDDPPPPVCALVLGEKIDYLGSNDAYYWYRDSVHAPNVIVPALMALERWLYLCLEQEKSIKLAIRQILQTSRSTALLGVLATVGRKHPELFKDELRDLVPLWQLQVWEENRNQQLESLLGMTMMQWTRWGEDIFNMVRDWHALDHRKKPLGDILFKLFVTDEEFRLHMKDVQCLWNGQLGQLGQSNDAKCLENITLRFDEKNWTARKIENGIALEFVEPEEKTQRLAAEREANERHIEVLTFPLSCRKMIDARKKLDAIELERVWQRLQRIGDNAEQARISGDTPEDAILGGIAVLYVLDREWTEADTEREKWCGKQFMKVINSPPPHPQFHIAESISNYHWNNFAAMMLPQLLTEDQSFEGLRALCADFALAFNYSVIQDLMTFAFEYRADLKDDFNRLQHLILVSSGIRNVNVVTHGGNSYWACPEIKFDIGSRFNELIDAFARSILPTELPRLYDVAEEATDTIVEMVSRQHKITYDEPSSDATQSAIAKRIKRGWGFEPFHVKAGFSWLERLDTETDPKKRARWIATIENILHGFLRPLGGIEEALFDDEDHNSCFAVPGEWVTWIFDLVASVIPKLEPHETARKLWEPILTFGLDRVHWLNSFISAWFIHGLKVKGGEEMFFSEWKEMIAFAWSRENWRRSEVRSHHSDDELFRHLMGFSNFGYGYLKDVKYRLFIAGMKPEFDKWTDEFFPHPEATSYFARFLTWPSAEDYLRDGVRRLAEASTKFEDWHWREFYHLDSALLDLLEHDWAINSRLIKNDTNIRQDFSIILKTMSDRQIPRAMELQDIMARSV